MIFYHLARVQIYVDLFHDEVYFHVKSYKLIKHLFKTFLKAVVEKFKIKLLKKQ